MMRVFRHAAILGGLSVSVLGLYHLGASASSSVATMPEEDTLSGVPDIILAALGSGYDFAALKNLTRTSDWVQTQYVDPDRIDYDKMFRASMDAVERSVPEVLLGVSEDGRRLHVEVANYATDLTIEPLDSMDKFRNQLRRVAALLDEHLDHESHDEPEKEVTFPDIEYVMINGMLSTLDPHSIFLPPENSKKMEEDNEGEFGGLGITIQLKKGQLTIEYPLVDTPAYRADLRADDRITKIDGEGTLNMDLDEAVSKMRGSPGSPVTLTVAREGVAGEKDYTIVREKIKPTKVWAVLLEGNVAYVRIDQFHQYVETQLDDELAKMARDAGPSGLKGIVLDLRSNPGGYLHQAVAVSDKFMTNGAIVATVERSGRNRDTKEARQDGNEAPAVPMAVLMNANSASASEIVAGALKNTERAVIIGERSFGKGSVQNLYPFNDGSKLKLTVARYLTPGDHSIQSVGIPADIELESAWIRPPREVDYEQHGEQLTEMSGPRVALFRSDRYQRESDLSGHLANSEEAGPPPVYRVRYLDDTPEGQARTDRPDPRKDFQAMLARDVLLATSGTRRPDVLRDAGTVVAARQKSEATRIEGAFGAPGVGVDWKACQNPDVADVRMTAKLGEEGVLEAGEWATLHLDVTNVGNRPLCQTTVLSRSSNDYVDGNEFYIGHLAPGQTRGYDVKVKLADGYPGEESAVWLDLIDPTRKVLATAMQPVITRGEPLPRYAWSYSFSDKKGGDGDGALEVGETIEVNVDVLNVGKGPGGVAEFYLKKGPTMGKAIELREGNFKAPTLAPGARASGVLSFKVAQAPTEGPVELELRVHDGERIDYASIIKAEFYAFAGQSERISVPIGDVPPAGRREPPAISISRTPGATSTESLVTVSGVATDDTGIADVIVYAGQHEAMRKIAYAGGGEGTPLKSVPFTATAPLADGTNLVVVLVRDVNGFTTTQAVDVYRPPVESPRAELVAPGVPKRGVQ